MVVFFLFHIVGSASVSLANTYYSALPPLCSHNHMIDIDFLIIVMYGTGMFSFLRLFVMLWVWRMKTKERELMVSLLGVSQIQYSRWDIRGEWNMTRIMRRHTFTILWVFERWWMSGWLECERGNCWRCVGKE